MNVIKKEGSDVAKTAVTNTVEANARTLRSLTKRITDAIQRTGKA